MERVNLAKRSAVSQFYENGVSLTVSKIINRLPIAGSVANHEAAHIVVAGTIRRATIIRSGNALGTTEPVKMTAAAAAAAAAMGYGGFGWDKFLTENYLGVAFESAKAQARAKLKGREEVRQEIATLLQIRKTIGQTDVDEAYENVRLRRNGIYPVEIKVFYKKGPIRRYTAKSYHEQVLIPGEWLNLSAA